ncbi:MAG: hypothetical protein ACYTHM_00090 [Planctomycetota bacterium]|jgi:hypothetical protein
MKRTLIIMAGMFFLLLPPGFVWAMEEEGEVQERLLRIEEKLDALTKIVRGLVQGSVRESPQDAIIESLREKNATLIKEIRAWRNRVDALESMLEQTKNDGINLEKKWNEMRANYESLNQKFGMLAEDLRQIQKEKTAALARRDDAEKLMEQAVEDRQRMQKQLEDLPQKIILLRDRNLNLARKNKEMEWVLKQVAQKHGIPIEELFGLLLLKIEGTVTDASNRVNLLVINVGEEDKVKVGYVFEVFRMNAIIGKIVVEKVYPQQAACRAILKLTKSRIRAGDRVVFAYRKPKEVPEEALSFPPCGRVVRTEIAQGHVYIDRGTKQHSKPGMHFQVFQGKKVKGEIRVMRVEQDFSLCSILKTTDEKDPIAADDSIGNRFIAPGKQLIYIFLGRFGEEATRYSKKRMIAILKPTAPVIVHAAEAEMHFAILGADADKDPQYEKAKASGAEMITPEEVVRWLGQGR